MRADKLLDPPARESPVATTRPRAGTGAAVLTCLVVAIGVAGCVSQPQNIRSTASRLGFEEELIQGSRYAHLVFRNYTRPSSRNLHVYIEGDGSPWIGRRRIAMDPTPRNPVAIQLMGQDSAPSLFLGRPCYFGQARVPPCEPSLWTSARYSETVVDSMQQALQRIVADGGFRHLVLIGYSGGGTLAVLLAERLPETRTVVTVAANLDIEAWTSVRDYSPLTGSLNPVERPPLDPSLWQLHLAGQRDAVVPLSVTRSYVRRQHHASLVVYEGFDHTCCWERIWPEVLQMIDSSNTGTADRVE